jgi:hypothetical protein
MDTSVLEQEFLNCDLSPFAAHRQLFSSRIKDNIFPPYVPWVGPQYAQGGIIIYGTAQNLNENTETGGVFALNEDKLVQRLRYMPWNEWQPVNGFQGVSINPYAAGILPALAGVWQYLHGGNASSHLDDVNKQVAATNYYKFSLRNGKRDMNPNSLANDEFGREYRQVNDALTRLELNYLKPNALIVIRGRHSGVLASEASATGRTLLEVNDPAWMLRGGGSCFNVSGSWHIKASSVTDRKILDLGAGWSELIPAWSKYHNKKMVVRDYLLCYYQDWLNKLKSQ